MSYESAGREQRDLVDRGPEAEPCFGDQSTAAGIGGRFTPGLGSVGRPAGTGAAGASARRLAKLA